MGCLCTMFETHVLHNRNITDMLHGIQLKENRFFHCYIYSGLARIATSILTPDFTQSVMEGAAQLGADRARVKMTTLQQRVTPLEPFTNLFKLTTAGLEEIARPLGISVAKVGNNPRNAELIASIFMHYMQISEATREAILPEVILACKGNKENTENLARSLQLKISNEYRHKLMERILAHYRRAELEAKPLGMPSQLQHGTKPINPSLAQPGVGLSSVPFDPHALSPIPTGLGSQST